MSNIFDELCNSFFPERSTTNRHGNINRQSIISQRSDVNSQNNISQRNDVNRQNNIGQHSNDNQHSNNNQQSDASQRNDSYCPNPTKISTQMSYGRYRAFNELVNGCYRKECEENHKQYLCNIEGSKHVHLLTITIDIDPKLFQDSRFTHICIYDSMGIIVYCEDRFDLHHVIQLPINKEAMGKTIQLEFQTRDPRGRGSLVSPVGMDAEWCRTIGSRTVQWEKFTIPKIDIEPYGRPDYHPVTYQCQICHKNIEWYNVYMSTCGHTFHHDCIWKYISDNKYTTHVQHYYSKTWKESVEVATTFPCYVCKKMLE